MNRRKTYLPGILRTVLRLGRKNRSTQIAYDGVWQSVSGVDFVPREIENRPLDPVDSLSFSAYAHAGTGESGFLAIGVGHRLLEMWRSCSRR
jgi:hypothetical protein